MRNSLAVGECANRPRMGRSNAVVSFCGTEYKKKASLYSAVCAVRDRSDTTFERMPRNCAVSSGLRVSSPQTQLTSCGYAASVSLFARRSTTKFLLTCRTIQLNADCH